MAQANDIAVVSAGVVSSIGLTAASTCAAIRASFDNFQETHFVDEVNESLLGAPVTPGLLGLEQEADGSILGGEVKLARMFVRAATECVLAAGGIDATVTALLLLGPESSRPGFSIEKLERCYVACEEAVGKSFHDASRILQGGSPGLAHALIYARQLLIEGKVNKVLIAGIDSLLNTEDINDALANERLLSSNNADGFIPGEAAACVLVTRLDQVAPTIPLPGGGSAPRPAVLTVAGVGVAEESALLQDHQPSRGLALAHAMRNALEEAQQPAHAIHARWSDISAESYFFEEASYAWSRVLRVRSPEGYGFHTPMNRVGHVGAAMGPMILAALLDGARKAWAEGPAALIQLSSAGAPRGAIVTLAA